MFKIQHFFKYNLKSKSLSFIKFSEIKIAKSGKKYRKAENIGQHS